MGVMSTACAKVRFHPDYEVFSPFGCQVASSSLHTRISGDSPLTPLFDNGFKFELDIVKERGLGGEFLLLPPLFTKERGPGGESLL
jgi:hypothetical protein